MQELRRVRSGVLCEKVRRGSSSPQRSKVLSPALLFSAELLIRLWKKEKAAETRWPVCVLTVEPQCC